MLKYIFIFGCIANLVICISGFIFGYLWQFFIIGASNIVVGTLLLRNNPFGNTLGKLLIFGPFIALYLTLSVILTFENNFVPIPFVIIAGISAAAAIIIFDRKLKNATAFLLLFIGLNATGGLFIANYYDWIFDITDQTQLEGKSLATLNLELKNEDGSKFDIRELHGKISVIDVWASSCGICISSFPKYEGVKKDYSDAKEISFYSLNIALERDDAEKIRRFTSPFSFRKLYTGLDGFDKLGINGVPYYLIINKNLEVEYAGPLLTRRTSIYNNFHAMIKEIRNKS